MAFLIFYDRYTGVCDVGNTTVLNKLLHLGSLFSHDGKCSRPCKVHSVVNVFGIFRARGAVHLWRCWKLDGIRRNTLSVGVLGAGIYRG